MAKNVLTVLPDREDDLDAPRAALERFDREALRARMAADNKRGHLPAPAGSVPMVLLRRLGEPVRHASGLPLTAGPADTALDVFEKVAASEVVPHEDV